MVNNEKIGIIAGNRLLPIILAQKIKQKNRNCEIVAVCFKGETSRAIREHVDKTYWLNAGSLGDLRRVLKKEKLTQCIMAGQINPLRIFKRKNWDKELISLVNDMEDFRPHTIFTKIIDFLRSEGINFLNSISYLKEDLAEEGIMNELPLNEDFKKDIDFGLKIISGFVELDVGQTIAVKNGATVALEALEGTNGAILRAVRIAGQGCTILKFSKANQDLRFDVPVVGVSTLRLLRYIKSAGLILERDKVIILQKPEFLALARRWKIPVIGKERLI